MRAAIVLAGVLALGSMMPVGTTLAADANTPAAATDCAAAETPAAQLICRDSALGAAAEKLAGALNAFGEEAGDAGREALASSQRAWVQRRDAACPVTDADLADPKKAKDRSACLSRQIAERTKALEEERAARRAPVADQPLTITDAAPPRAAALPTAKPVPPKRPAGAQALAGRWAKADPATRTPIDDCRASYLEISKDSALGLHDPRIAGLPVEGRVAFEDGDAAQGLAFRSDAQPADAGLQGSLRLDAGDAPRLDRLFLRLDKPVAFGATFVRCR